MKKNFFDNYLKIITKFERVQHKNFCYVYWQCIETVSKTFYKDFLEATCQTFLTKKKNLLFTQNLS